MRDFSENITDRVEVFLFWPESTGSPPPLDWQKLGAILLGLAKTVYSGLHNCLRLLFVCFMTLFKPF